MCINTTGISTKDQAVGGPVSKPVIWDITTAFLGQFAFWRALKFSGEKIDNHYIVHIEQCIFLSNWMYNTYDIIHMI